MSRLRSTLTLSAFLAPACLAPALLAPSAQAQAITFTLNQTDATVVQGGAFTFTGTIVNNTDQAMRCSSLVSPEEPHGAYSLDYSSLVFPSLAARGSYSGALFTVDAFRGQSPTPVGTYHSEAAAYYFQNAALQSWESNPQQFTLHVQPVPEASSVVSLGLLLALGLGGMTMSRRRKARTP